MNKPIGIPSGWEEIAAWVCCLFEPMWVDDVFYDLRYPITAEHYTINTHDWRVEE